MKFISPIRKCSCATRPDGLRQALTFAGICIS